MASKWVKMKFLELGVNRKVVGNVENYLNMQFQPKIFTRSQENAETPHFLKIAYKKNRFFLIISKNTVDTGFKLHI